MIWILTLDAIVVFWMLFWGWTRGFEEVLPGTAFLLLLLPNEAQVELAGWFDLTTHRILVLTLVILFVARPREADGTSLERSVPMRTFLVAVAGWMMLSTANSVVRLVSFKATLSQLFDYFAIYVLYFKGVTKSETLDKILNGLVMAMLVASGFGAVEAYTGWSVLSLFPTQTSRFSDLAGVVNDRGARVQSTFGHAILFGAALVMVFPAILYLLGKAKTRGRQLLLWTCLLLMVLCTYKTGSRGPWLALGMTVVVLLFAGMRSMRRSLLIMATLVVLVWMLRPGVGQSIGSMVQATRDPTTPEGESYRWRWMLYGLARRELAKDPARMLWGYGPESFYYLNLTAPFLIDGEERTVKVLSCDSAVVEIMMDLGYVGLALIGAILAGTAYTGLRFYFACNPEERALPLVLLLALGVFGFMMTNVEIYGWGQQNYMVWIVISLIQVLPFLATVHENDHTLAEEQEEGRTALLSWGSP